MMTRYSHIAGHSLERLATLSDGVFAIAMTLLVLDLHVPLFSAIHSEAGLWSALVVLGPKLLTYLMSFMTLGIFWVGQQTQHNYMAHANRAHTWLHVVFLMAVSLVPFSTALLSEFITYRVALIVYWANILALGVILIVTWRHARRHGLVKHDAPGDLDVALQRRIFIAEGFVALGAALCVINTWWSIGFIAVVQVGFVFAPPIKPFA